MMDKKLQELFSLPIGLKTVAIIDGQKFFSSDKLKQTFIQTFENSGRGKPIADDIKKMVESGLITPCYLHKGLFKFILHRSFGGSSKTIMGFYHKESKKVYVLIDNEVNIFGVGSTNRLAATTMHECMHLLAGTNPSAFLSIFKSLLTAYYSVAFSFIFKIKSIEQTSVQRIFKFLIDFETESDFSINKKLGDYFRLLEKEFRPQSSLDETQFRRLLTDYIVSLKILLTNFQVFVRVAGKYMHILTPLQNSYERAFGEKNVYTTAIQELIYPSEIACVYAEMKPTSSFIQKAFKAMS